MNEIWIENTGKGYTIHYLLGWDVKTGHEDIKATDELELSKRLRDEGVPEASISGALEDLRHNPRTTLKFPRRSRG